MKQLLRKLVKYLAYTAAAAVIVLAIAVGLFRLMLPRLPAYQEQIKDWADSAIGMRVEFSGMDARWRLSGPELNFYDARLMARDDDVTLLQAEEVSVGVALSRLLLDRELVADRILIHDSVLDVTHAADGWRVQGFDVDEFIQARMESSGQAGPLVVVGEDIRVNVRQPERNLSVSLDIENVNFNRDESYLGFNATLRLPPELGDRMQVAASQRRAAGSALSPWQFFIEGAALNAAGLSSRWPDSPVTFGSGSVDLSLWLDLSAEGVHRATANFVMKDIVAAAAPEQQPVSARGRVEFARREQEWLVAADEFVLATVEGEWPQSSLQLRVAEEGPGRKQRIEASATWMDFGDWPHLAPWFSEALRARLTELAPSGVVRDFSATVIRVDREVEQFDVAAALEGVGIASFRDWPGFRGFSGSLRADQSGGRLEADADVMTLDLSAWLPRPVDLKRAVGTIIWRRGGDGITILSDSVRLATADLDSISSLHITLPADNTSPIIDLQSNWSIGDLSAADRYLPAGPIKPALHRWLSNALVAGTAPSGSMRFVGALDRFPFDEDDGVFRIDARVEDAILRYHDDWPAVRIADLDLVVDRMRLYTEQNVASTLGNDAVDARVEIPDLRNPVLKIDATASGTLETIRDFSRQSPIAALFGGHLDRIGVAGEASLTLDLVYPILDRENWQVTAVIRPEDGTVRIDGFPAPVTGLDGAVTIRRSSLQAEGLRGTFLGHPAEIDLARLDDPAYDVAVYANGRVGASDLGRELGVPIDGLIEGATGYSLAIRFPRAALEQPPPVEIALDSDLSGMAVHTPPPLGKAAEPRRPLSATIGFPVRDRIQSTGSLADNVRWSLGFENGAGGWDFDRGVVALGGAAPGEPASRGLHIEGRTPEVDVDQWLDLTRGEGDAPGVGERIRSIDLVVDRLRVIGQHLGRHRLVVNRSALDWAVQLDGEQARGTVSIPYELDGERAIVLDMERLVLPGAEEGAQTKSRPLADPRSLPRITVSAGQFSLGNRHLGSLKADFARTALGLEASSLIAESASFDLSGNAGWIVDESDPLGQRSYLEARLTSSNVEQTLDQLDYQPGIESEALDVRLDVSWSGGPREDFLASLDGNVGVHFGTGQLDDVEPGAGRVFGLMSVVALPRRLSLDFRDVFERGFVFDEITGNFRLEDGVAYTCDLSLKGPAADVGIVGETDLVAKDYRQAAVVSANVGNTLPVVGAVVAGPQVAAALLIFSQIFKKPLQEMGQIYYGIDGSWSDPVIDTSDPQRFAEVSTRAGCIGQRE